MGRRILVTGSRDWSDEHLIHRALIGHANVGDTLVHGACRTGADAIADAIWRRYKVGPVEPHPVTAAVWARIGSSAGPARNRHMVNLGADVCLAFILPCTDPRCRRPGPHGTHGASGCADYAEQADIPTYRYPKET